MKVLWMVNHIMPALAEELNVRKSASGGWLVRLSDELVNICNVDLYIICPGNTYKKYVVNGITFITIPISYLDKFYRPSSKISNLIFELVSEVRPDIIHVQGTEFCFNSVFLKFNDIPVVFSIQGLISEIVEHKYDLVGLNRFGLATNFIEYIRVFRDFFRSKYEIKQLKKGKYFIGRTLWDEAHTYFNNHKRKYFFSPETIRNEFFEKKWNINNINRYSIFCAGGYARSLKGFHNILYAVSFLKNEYPNIVLIVPGEDIKNYKGGFGYKSKLRELLFKLGLEKVVRFTGALNSSDMAEEFSKSHIYLMGSSIENSSNTLCEAMCVGIPSVVPFVGGVPSLVESEKEALFYQSNDNFQSAWQIKRLFDSDDLCNKLSSNVINRSVIVYKNNDISGGIFNIYNNILG